MSKSSKDEGLATEVLSEYLEKSNRPYSAGDLHNNLQKQYAFGKTMVTRVLETMAAEGAIKEKCWGKSKIYFWDQDKLPTISEEEMADIDTKTARLTELQTELMNGIKVYDSKLSGSKREMTVGQIKTEINELRTEIKDLAAELEAIKERSQNVDPDANIAIKKERQQLVTEWRKRKRMAINMIDNITEGGSIPKKALMSEANVETDEDCGVTLPSL